jgi:hypothetical protein
MRAKKQTMKTKTRKLTICESRAKAFCDSLNQYDGGEIAVEWKRSAMWGCNPVISYRGGKCTNISGCGYDKLSAALASVLRFLFPVGSEAYHDIGGKGGAGWESVRGALNVHGWMLERTANGSSFDGFRLSSIGKEGV